MSFRALAKNPFQNKFIFVTKILIMKPKGCHNYFIYILTNANKTVLYTGVTNNIGRRLLEHNSNPANGKISFTVKYNCFYLIYFEHFSNINHAIEREKQIKGWSRKKKEDLINSLNPEWKFLNDEVKEI